MKNRTPKSSLKIVTVLGLGLVLSGCEATPTQVLSLDDLVGRLAIQLASVTGNNGAASSSGGMAFPAPAAALTEPALNEINVPAPGTPQVFQWPEVIDLPITPRFDGHDTVLSWPRIDWPDFDILSPEHRYFGHSGLVFYSRSRGQWYAISTEWLRDAREREGVRYPYEETFVEGPIQDGDPIGYFIAGPWRHQLNRPEYQRRSNITWFIWPTLEPLDWGGGGENPAEPMIEEVHVYITGLQTQLSGGTIVEFAVEIGDVDLLALRGQPVSIVDADVPAGTYQWVDFTVDPARSFLIIDGEQVALGIPLQNVIDVGREAPDRLVLGYMPDVKRPDAVDRLKAAVSACRKSLSLRGSSSLSRSRRPKSSVSFQRHLLVSPLDAS